MAKNFKKFFTAVTVAATIVYSVGLAAFVPAANAAVSAGTLVKASGAAVYYVGADMKRYVFPDEKSFKTWYADFSSVVTITDAELAAMAIGGNVTYRPGTKLIKITTDPKVYAVDAHGTLRWVTTEAIATCLYGASWGSYVQDVPDPFFVNYTQGNQINACSEFVPATATAAATSINVDKGLAAGVEGPVLSGGSVMVSLSSDTPASQTVPTDASVEVAKFNLKAGSAAAQISSITLTAAGLNVSSNITDATLYVDGVKATSGKTFNSDREATFTFSTPLAIAANATKSVAVRATITANGFYSVGIAAAADVVAGGTVTGSFPVNGNTMQATDSADVATVAIDDDGATGSAQFGDDDVLLADFSLTPDGEDVLFTSARFKNGGNNTTGIISNLRMVIDGTDAATGSYDSATGYVTFNISNFLIEDGETVAVEVRGDIGTSNDGDLIKLYVKDRADFEFVGQDYGYGAQLTDASYTDAINGLNTAAKALALTINTGDFSIDFDKAVTPSKDVQSDTDNVVLATLTMISNGENATINDIVDGGAGAEFRIEGIISWDDADAGNDVDSTETRALENVELVDISTGGIYSVAATYVNPTPATNGSGDEYFTLNLTDEDIALTKGVKKTFQVRADLTTAAANNNTFKVVLADDALDITGDVSNADISAITPSSVSSAVATVKDATLELTGVALTNKSVVEGAQGVEIYKGLLKAGDVDAVKITSFKLTAPATGAATNIFSDDNISQLDLYLNGVLLKSLSNQISEAAVGTITFNSLSTVNNANVVAKSSTVEVKVVARFSSNFANTGNFVTGVAVAGDVVARAVSDNDSVTITGTVPATIAVADGVNMAGESRLVTLADKGNLTVEVKDSGLLADEETLVIAGTSTPAGKYLAEIVFRTKNEAIKVTKLDFDQNGTATGMDIAAIKLVDGAGAVKASTTPDASGNALFENLSLVFAADTTTSYYLSVDTKGINVAGDTTSTATDGRSIQYQFDALTDVEAEGVDTSSDLTMVLDGDSSLDIATNEISSTLDPSNVAYIVGSKITSITNALTNPLDLDLQGGANKIVAKFKINVDNAGNRKTDDSAMMARIKNLTVSGSKSGSATNLVLSSFSAYNELVPGTPVAGTGVVGCATADTSCSVNFDLTGLANAGDLDGEVTIVVTATVAPTATEGEYVSLGIADIEDGAASDLRYDSDGDGVTEIGSAAAPVAYLGYDFVTGSTIKE